MIRQAESRRPWFDRPDGFRRMTTNPLLSFASNQPDASSNVRGLLYPRERVSTRRAANYTVNYTVIRRLLNFQLKTGIASIR